MIKVVFAVFDSKAGAFGMPMFLSSRGEATRSFSDIASDNQSMISKHPGDFTLFELGSYDVLTAKFTLLDTPQSLGLALEFLPKP